MCVTIEKDGLRSVPDGKSPVESGLCHVEWAVPGYCDGMIEKAQETVAPLGSEVKTHIERELVEAIGDALAEKVVKRIVGLEGRERDLLEHEHKVNARPVESQYCTEMTRAVQIAPLVRRNPEPRDGEHTLCKCKRPHTVLSIASATVMVQGELTSPTAHNAWPQNNHLWWSARGKQLDHG